jgi:hypothetical protein
MAFQCGFFNSINGDRKYNAEQMNNPYSRIISNGVFGNSESSTDFQVKSDSGLNIIVKQGQGIFSGKWSILDADMPLTIATPHVSMSRIDSIIVRIDNSDDVRAGSIEYKQGEASASPVPIKLENTANVKEYRLAKITVNPNVTQITQANITDCRPTGECGFIHNLLWDSDITTTYDQWHAQFHEWFDNLRETLASSTVLVSFTSKYITTAQDETVIPIGISQFKSVLDILQVYVNNLLCFEGTDYTVDNFNNIVLTNGVDKGTEIHFIVYKSMDGTGIDKFIEDVDDLISRQNEVESKVISLESTVNTLDAKLKNTSLQADESALDIVALISKTNTTNTNLSALTTKVTKNINDIAGLDTRINKLETVTYSPLWEGANQMGGSASITPSKKLDDCRNGWLLVWSGYNTSTNKATQTRLQFTYVPKNIMANLAVESMPIYSNLIYTYYESGTFDVTAKLVTITDDKITGFAGNVVTDFGKGICLMYVMEW